MGVDFVEDDGTLFDSVDLSDKNISIYPGPFLHKVQKIFHITVKHRAKYEFNI